MRRVLVVRNALLPLSETFVKQQALKLKTWQATLVGQRLTPKGLPLDGLQIHLTAPETLADRWRWRLFRRLGWPMPASLRALMAPADGIRPELIHAHFGVDAVTAWPWLRRLGLPVVVTLHGYDIHTHPESWESGQGGQHLRDYPRRLREMAADPRVSFIAVSEAVRQRAITGYQLPADKIEKVFIGVDVTTFRPGPITPGARPPHVLFVGRQVEKKGLEVLIRAMTRVRERFPEARVKVVGDGPLRARNEALAAELAAPVDFLGARSSEQVRRLMDACALFCLPSVVSATGDAEGLPISILEAQAAGVPVVTSAVGGRDEGIVDGRTGFGFAERDHEALAGHLCRLLGDNALRDDMGREARALAMERFDIRVCGRQLEALYARRAAGVTTPPASAVVGDVRP
ncbi:MAG: glycosyltransferase [Mitsuaria chitosanitabida]|nr:glycosyltransferase [Roseateles chitosanitabidus]